VEKAKKAEVVEDLNGVFAKAGSVVVAHYTGMTVAQMADLRSRMRANGASFRVAKNRLAVRALKGTPIEGIAHLFKGPTGIAISDDPVAASKVAAAYAKDNEKLVILGGAVGSTALDAAGVKALATLPSLDQLRGKIVGPACGTRDQDRRDCTGSRRSACPCHRRLFQEGRGLRRLLLNNVNIQT
jgi:large subunit ribosomal protein L10